MKCLTLLRKAIRCHVCDTNCWQHKMKGLLKKIAGIYTVTAVMTAIKNTGKNSMKDTAEQECVDLKPITKKAKEYLIRNGWLWRGG